MIILRERDVCGWLHVSPYDRLQWLAVLITEKEPSPFIKGSEFVEYISFSRRTRILGVCCLYGMNEELGFVVLWRELIRQTSFSPRIPGIFLDSRKAHKREHSSLPSYQFHASRIDPDIQLQSLCLLCKYLSLLIRLRKLWRLTCGNVCHGDSWSCILMLISNPLELEKP
jgi:hypothetical protein